MPYESVFPYDLVRWSRPRRLANTGPGNSNYRHGRWSRHRRERLQAPLEDALRRLLAVTSLSRRFIMFDTSYGQSINNELEWLMKENHPFKWALPDPRWAQWVHAGSPHQTPPPVEPRWYIPRVAWEYAGAWIRRARQCIRRIFLALDTIVGPIPPSLSKRIGGGRSQPMTLPRCDPRAELERYRQHELTRGRPDPTALT